MEKLKKHSFDAKKPNILPKISKTSSKLNEKIALLGPFKGPCTLP